MLIVNLSLFIAMKNIPITIGLPFYNAEDFLQGAIQSVFAQTYENWELILFNDGSIDKSLEIARSVQDPRVRVYSDGENRGLAARLNQIVKLAKYDVIVRMDADDLMSSVRIEKQMQILALNPSLDLVTTGLFSVSDDLKPLGMRWHHATVISFNELLYKRGCGVVHAALVGRKSWFLRNPYDSTLKVAQDYDLWLRSCSEGDFKIHLIQEPLYYYRELGNVTVEKIKKARKNERKMYWKYGNRVHIIPLILVSYLKSGVAIFLDKINRINYLLQRRNNNVEAGEHLDNYYKQVQIVFETKYNGFKK